MGLFDRLAAVLSGKANELLDHFDDPGEALDYEYELLLDDRRHVEQAVDDVAGALRRLVHESSELSTITNSLEARARQSVIAGNDDLASEALARRKVLEDGIDALGQQADEIGAEEDRFTEAARRLDAVVSALSSRKEVLKARYSVTRERTEIDEALSQVRKGAEEIRDVVRRAENKVAEVQSRTSAIDSFIASRALDNLDESPLLIEAELGRARASEDVQSALFQLKASVGH